MRFVLVVCHPRTGSHMFGELLDSHPEVEFLSEAINRGHSREQLEAVIGARRSASEVLVADLKYEQLDVLWDWDRGNRVPTWLPCVVDTIHLIRNPFDVFVSDYAWRLNFDRPPPALKIGYEEFYRRVDWVRQRMERAGRQLRRRGARSMTVSYEELVGRSEVLEELHPSVVWRLTSFLGVKRAPMSTRTRQKETKNWRDLIEFKD